MTQLDIWFSDVPAFPRARRTDPSSSHDAATMVEDLGIAKAQAQRVLDALRRFPMATSKELSKLAGLDRVMVARRLPELAKAGIVDRYDPTKDTKPCEVSGIRSVRWCVR